MMELSYQLINRTIGLDWSRVRDSHQLIQQLQADLGRIREEFPKVVGSEFAHVTGTSLGDFTVQWRNLMAEVEDQKTNMSQICKINDVKKANKVINVICLKIT